MISEDLPTLPTGRLLLVEDDANSAAILSQVLSSVGNDVEIAADGRQALSKIEEFNPDVILMDLQMPGRDGFELARLIRMNPRRAHLPIIMMSGLSDREVRLRAAHCGADDFVSKPLTTEDLFTRIANGLRLLETRKELFQLRKENEVLKTQAGSPRASVDGLRNCIENATSSLRRSLLEYVAVAEMQETSDRKGDSGSAFQAKSASDADFSRFDGVATETEDRQESGPVFHRAIRPADKMTTTQSLPG